MGHGARVRRVLAIGLVMLVLMGSNSLTGLPVASADAGSVPVQDNWSGANQRNAFAPWGDPNPYYRIAGGSVEWGTPGWTRYGYAGVTAENSPWCWWGLGGRYSMRIPSGSQAATPAYPVIYNGGVRFFMKAPSGGSSRLHVRIQTYSAQYADYMQPLAAYDYVMTYPMWGWYPSPILAVPDSMRGHGVQMLSVIFWVDGGGVWQVDDVSLDPYKAR